MTSVVLANRDGWNARPKLLNQPISTGSTSVSRTYSPIEHQMNKVISEMLIQFSTPSTYTNIKKPSIHNVLKSVGGLAAVSFIAKSLEEPVEAIEERLKNDPRIRKSRMKSSSGWDVYYIDSFKNRFIAYLLYFRYINSLKY